MDAAKNYYQILGIPPDADAPAIQAAYRALAKKFHPDAPASTRSTERFIEIQEAYDVLGSSESKQDYDAAREAGSEDQEREKRATDEEAIWQSLLRDHPEIKEQHAGLSRLAKSLARQYRSGILAGVDDRSPEDFVRHLEDAFLSRHFGTDPQMQYLGKTLLADGQRAAAAQLATEIKKLPRGRLTRIQRRHLLARYKPARKTQPPPPDRWSRAAPFVGVLVLLAMIGIGVAEFLMSGPTDMPAAQVATPSFGGPKPEDVRDTILPQEATASKPIDERIPDEQFTEPDTTATIARDDAPPPIPVTEPKKRIYDRILATD